MNELRNSETALREFHKLMLIVLFQEIVENQGSRGLKSALRLRFHFSQTMSDQHPGHPPSQPKLRRGVCFQNCYFMSTMPNARTEENANRRIGETATVINRSALSFTVSPFRHFAVSTSLTGLLLTLLSVSAVRAATSNPYGGIVDRNVFSLKPAPLVDPTPAAPPTPPVKLTLNGITTILGNKRALLHAQIPPHPPEPAKEENYMLTEGQRDGSVEVLSIDERAGIVKVNNNGLTETLDFVNNGAKAVASAAPAGSNIPLPVHPAAARPSNTQQNVQQNTMTPEEQVVMIEAQREYFSQQGDSTAIILPPTAMTPPGSPGSGIELPQ